MICKKKKNKFIYAFLLSLILVCGLLQSSVLSCNSYASESITVGQYLQSQDFYDVCAWYYRKIGSIPDAYSAGGTGPTFSAFADYLENKDKGYLLEETVTEVETGSGASGGRGYDLPQEARQEIVNYITENYVENNPLTYKIATVTSYKYLSASQFNNYNLYASLQNFIKSQDGYTFISGHIAYGSFNGSGMIYVIPRSVNHGFYGTCSNGIFTSVQNVVNWQGGNVWDYDERIKRYNFTADGTITEWKTGDYWLASPYIYNGATIPIDYQHYNVFTNSDKNEAVYVFDNINAYKNYNAGVPQPYYLLTDQQVTVPNTDIVTSEDLQKAGNFYNSIVNNVNAGDSAEEVQKTVKNGLLGNLLDTLTGSNSGVVEDNGNFDMSFLGTIKELVLGVTGAIQPAEELINNDLKRFVTDVFGWLPEELVIFWTAGIIFAVFFGILKIVRG